MNHLLGRTSDPHGSQRFLVETLRRMRLVLVSSLIALAGAGLLSSCGDDDKGSEPAEPKAHL